MLHFKTSTASVPKIPLRIKGLLSQKGVDNNNNNKKDKILAAPIIPTKKAGTTPSSGGSLVKDIKLPEPRILQKKWEKFARHNSLYEDTVEAYHFIGRVLSSQEFMNRANRFYQPSTTAGDLQKFLSDHGKNFFHMAIKDKYVETVVDMEEFSVQLNLGGDPQRLMDAENIIQSIFGSNFKIPSSWSRRVSNGADGFDSSIISVGENMNVQIPLEKIASLPVRYTMQEPLSKKEKKIEPKFSLEKSHWTNRFNNIALLDLTLVLDDVSIGSLPSSADEGTLKDSTKTVYMSVRAKGVFRWPLEFAFYATCCEKASDFIPFLFFQYITWHRSAYGMGKSRGGGFAANPPNRISNLGNITRRNESEKKKGRNPKIRANEDGFTIIGVGEPSKTGSVYWIPEDVNKLSEYIEQIKKAYNQAENRFDLSNVKLRGEGLFTDPFNDKFTYFREGGVSGRLAADISGIITVDLTGSVPLDRVTIYKDLTEDIRNSDTFGWFISLLQKFANGEWKNAKPTKNYNAAYLESVGLPKDYRLNGTVFDFCKRQINTNREPFTWANVGGYPVDDIINGDIVNEKDDPDSFKLKRAACNIIKDVANDMLQQLDKAEIGYAFKLDSVRYFLFMITKYAGYMETDPKHPQKYGLRKQYFDAIKKNDTGVITKEVYEQAAKEILAPNLPNLKELMPHQLETAIYTKDNPAGSLIEVSAGGGKTAIDIREVCEMLYKGLIKRPIVVAPGGLVRNWVNEIYFFSKGKVNAFALNIYALRRLQYLYNGNTDPTQKPDYAMLKKIIDDLPPNTIIVTSYNFLSVDRESIVYGNETILRLYAAEFLRDIPCDFVGVDESHYGKNLKSNRTLGISILESAAKYKRALSGTTVNDSLDDLIGQTGTMVPVALGSESQFNSRYLTKSGAIKPDAPEMITADIKPYIQRIVHKRQKWAVLLPRLSEQFHPVRMTPRQQEFYTQLLKGALEELKKKNPKLAAKLIDGGNETEKDNNAIERGLGMYLQAVEQFIYAPDSNAAFLELEDLDPEDLVSPKIAELTKILDNHFNGYTDPNGVKVEADPNKVIIFSHRRKTSEHIMKHLPAKYAKKAIRYTAGDFKALQAFLKDDRVQIIVADEISINTGQNFQLASRMIRLETLWSPGDQEQALARIWRPDFKSLVQRKRVFLDWIFTDNSLEVCKIGRLISKIVVKMKYDQQDNPHFTKEKFKPSATFIKLRGNRIPQVSQNIPVNMMLSGSTLKLVKMNTSNMLNFNSRMQLAEYFDIYALANHWEDSEFERLAKDPRYSKTITLPPSAYVEIKGSAKIPYIPRVPGIEPIVIDPENKMGYKPISVVENEMANASEEEDDDDSEEINPVSINDIVDTEFGIGEVTKIYNKDIKVRIRGLREVNVPKATAWLITNEKALEQVRTLMIKAGKRGIIRIPEAVANTIRIQPSKEPDIKFSQEDIEEIKHDTPQGDIRKKYDDYDVDVDDDDDNIDISAELIDGQIALTAYLEDDDTKILLEEYGFKVQDSYIAIRIRTPEAFDKVTKALFTKFNVMEKYQENINFYRKYLVNKTLGTVTTESLAQTLKFFGAEYDRPIKKGSLRPYPIVWGKRFFIAFNKKANQSSREAQVLVRGLGLGDNAHIYQEDELVVKFYKTANAAIEDLHDISETIGVKNKELAIKFLGNVQRKAPSKPSNPIFKLNKNTVRKPLEEDISEEDDDDNDDDDNGKTNVKPKPVNKPIIKPRTAILSPKKEQEKVVEKAKTKNPIFKFNLGRGKVR